MALRVSLLFLVCVVISAAKANEEEWPECVIPEGHHDGERTAYYDPEPRIG